MLVDVGNTRVCHYQGAIVGPDPFSLLLARCLHDPDWLASGLLGDVRKREREEREERGGGGLSEAVAIAEMVRQWMDSDGESRLFTQKIISQIFVNHTFTHAVVSLLLQYLSVARLYNSNNKIQGVVFCGCGQQWRLLRLPRGCGLQRTSEERGRGVESGTRS